MGVSSKKAAPADLWIVVPVSGVARGKSRLAAVLAPDERARLNRWLLRRTVAVAVAAAPSGQCLVISPCARSRRLARLEGARSLVDARPAHGLNAAVRRAIRWALRRGAKRVLVLPTDLPRLTAEALEGVLRHARAGARCVVVPDREECGTNALVIPVRPSTEAHFGEASFDRHVQAGQAAGYTVTVVRNVALMDDIDTPAHLKAWRKVSDPAT